MFYDTAKDDHGLKFNPFKALVVPRPIGWIGSVSKAGVRNLAPYSFFNAVSDTPPMVFFSSAGNKDSLANILETGEFTCSMSSKALTDAMNLSSAALAPDVDEFAVAGLTPAPSRLIKAPWVAEAPSAFECRLWKTIDMPANKHGTCYTVVIGEVLGVHINDAFIKDGMVDTAGMEPLARMGYMDYSVVTRESTFTLNRPTTDKERRTAQVQSGPWDGVYR